MARFNSITCITFFSWLVFAGLLFAGRGWTAGWDQPSVQLAGPLGTNWVTAGWTDILNGTDVVDNVALTSAHTEPVLRYFVKGSSTNTFLAEVDRLTDRTASTYDVTKYAYGTAGDSNNLLVDVYDPRGVRVLRNAYGHNATGVADGRMTSQTDANGNTKTTQYDDLDRPAAQDALGNMTSVALDGYGHPWQSVDANGNTSYTIYTNTLPASTFDPAGTETDYTYGTASDSPYFVGGLVTSQIQTLDNVLYTVVTTNSYYGVASSTSNLLGELKSTLEMWVLGGTVQAPYASATLYQYDANGNRTLQTQTNTVNGVVNTVLTMQFVYDGQNRLIQTIDPLGHTNTTVYNHLGRQDHTTDALGRVTSYIYDPAGNLLQTAYPDGTATRTTYDEKNRAVYTQDRALPDGSGKTTAAASVNIYDPAGRVIRVERWTGVALKVAATTNGFVALSTGTTETQYQITTNGAGTRASFTRTVFDLGGRVQYAMDARGTVTEYRYDAADRRTNTLVYTNYSVSLSDVNAAIAPGTNGAMKTISLYDPNGNQVAVIDNLGRTNVYQYDSANRLIETDYPAVAGDALHITLTDYDGAGRKIREMDEAGVWTAYSYDFRGLLTSVVQDYGRPDALITTYAYDLLGNLISQVDANNGTDGNSHTTSYLYDQLGRRTVRLLPGGQTETNSYDAVGNLAIYTSFNGVRFTNQYDAVNRLTSRASTNGYKVTYTYTATGQRQTMTDSTGTNKWIYDALNRTITNSSPVGTLIYAYDVAGSVTNIHSGTSGGVNLGYGYDCLGRLVNVTTSTTNVATYAYDGVGNLAALSYTNGVTNLYQYTAQNRLTSLVWKHGATPLASFQYQLGMAGNRTNLSETVNGTAGSYAWTYDNLYRMTNEGINGNTISYVLDNVGNRTSRNSSGVTLVTTTNNTFGSNDRLTSDTYDANGNTLVSGGAASWYDVENRLTTHSNTTAITMTYNGDGMRVGKTVGGVTTTYLVDTVNPTGYPQVLEERSGGSLSKVYAYGTALINQRQASSGVVRYYGMDGHGSVRFLTDTSGSVSDTYSYDAFGIGIASSGSTANNYLYSGEQWDPDLGMYYLRARYYRPDSGRFWTMDTYEGRSYDPRSLHKYLYCAVNPVNNIDRSGHMELSSMVIGIGIGAVIGGVIYYEFTHSKFITKARVMNALESASRDPTPAESSRIAAGFDLINSAAFFNALGSINDGTTELKIVTDPNVLVAAQFYLKPGTIYVPLSQFNDPRGDAWVAFFVFGEYQDAKMGNSLSETEAQLQLDAITQGLNSPYNSWRFEHGGHD